MDMFNKAKGMLGSKSSGSSSTGHSSTGGSASGTAGYINKGVDMFTDKVGLGDKYDKQIGDQVNKRYDTYQKGHKK